MHWFSICGSCVANAKHTLVSSCRPAVLLLYTLIRFIHCSATTLASSQVVKQQQPPFWLTNLHTDWEGTIMLQQSGLECPCVKGATAVQVVKGRNRFSLWKMLAMLLVQLKFQCKISNLDFSSFFIGLFILPTQAMKGLCKELKQNSFFFANNRFFLML